MGMHPSLPQHLNTTVYHIDAVTIWNCNAKLAMHLFPLSILALQSVPRLV